MRWIERPSPQKYGKQRLFPVSFSARQYQNGLSAMSLSVIHLDDNVYDLEAFKKTVERGIDDLAFVVQSVADVASFRRLALDLEYQIVVLDIHLTDAGDDAQGIDLIAFVRDALPKATVVIRSESDSPRFVTKALRLGADDFISKKIGEGELCLRLYHAHRLTQSRLGGQASATVAVGTLIGKTMSGLSQRMARLVASQVNCILVTGESGTGKEVVADLVESQLSKGTPFIRINCGAISPTLLESELFGHMKGAFTGATHDRRGFFEAADGGWIFLDEVTTLSRHAQVALLRVIENGELLRVGSSSTRKINVRIVAATNEDFSKLIAEDKFRNDLWQRLREVELHLSPLRERRDEIRPLAQHFAKSMGRGYELTEPVLAVLERASWTNGNVRELRNCVRAMTEYSVEGKLTPLSLPVRIVEEVDRLSEGVDGRDVKIPVLSSPQVTLALAPMDPLNYEALCDQLLVMLTHMATEASGKLSLRALAKILSVPRTTLSTKLKQLVERNVLSMDELVRMVSIRGDSGND